MLDDRETRKEALIVVATFLFATLSQKFDLISFIFNFFKNLVNDNWISAILSAVALFLAIPIVLFVISYVIISFIDSVIEWAERNKILTKSQ